MTNTDTRPKWPKTEPNAETLLQYLAGRGVWVTSAIWPAMDRDKEDGGARSDRLMYQAMASHDTFLTLTALRDCDPVRADEVAARLWLAAEAGDSYGEWLWEWATASGLDAEAISSDAHDAMEATEREEPKL